MLPRWGSEGKELLYQRGNFGIFVAEIKARNAPNQFEVGAARQLTNSLVSSYDVSSNGQRLLIDGAETISGNSSRLTVVINWMKELAVKK